MGDEAETRRDGPIKRVPDRDLESYDVGRELGRGGMGRVNEARDRKLDRPVAVKRLLATSGEAAERFRREARLTARLQHPGIVPVYEQGEDEHGAPYYAMRLVEGTTLASAIDEASTLEKRIALVPIVLQVADTIAYAHAQHVIHRDLKPSNIMLGAFGETLVVDWGLAKDLAEDDVTRPRMTGHGKVMGTPSYMSPEQAVGDEVDQRTDVYALGAILSQILDGISGVPVELVAIAAKGKAELPEDRYTTAGEFAEDLRRFATGQLVAAHRYTLAERAARLARRHRNVLLGVLAAVVAAGIAATVMFTRVLAARDAARVERDRAIVARARAELDRDPSRVDGLLAGVDHPDVAMLRANARVVGVAHVQTALATTLAVLDGVVWHGHERTVYVNGTVVTKLAGPVEDMRVVGKRVFVRGGDEIIPIANGIEQPPIACAGNSVLAALGSERALCVSRGASEIVDLTTGERRALSSELLSIAQIGGNRIVARDGQGVVYAFDATTLATIGTLAPGADSPNALAIVGDRVAVARGIEVLAWDPATGAIEPYPEVDAASLDLATSADGTRLAILQLDGMLRVYDTKSRRQLREWNVGRDATMLRLSPDGNRIAFASRNEVHVLPIGVARRWKLLGHAALITDLVWGPRGVISASRDGTIRTWELDEPIAVAVENPIVQPRIAFGAGRALVWELATVRELVGGTTKIVDTAQVWSASYAPDGTILTAEMSGRVRRGTVVLGTEAPGPWLTIAGTPDGRVIAHAARTKKRASFVRVWDREGKSLPVCDGEPLALSVDGTRLTVATTSGFAICDTQTRKATPIDAPGANHIGFSRDGWLQIHRESGIEVRTSRGSYKLPATEVFAVARDRYAVKSASSTTVTVARFGESPTELRARGLDGVQQLVWSPDSKTLAAVSRNHVCVWKPAESVEGYCLPHDRVGEAMFSPDGHLATSAPGGVLVWTL